MNRPKNIAILMVLALILGLYGSANAAAVDNPAAPADWRLVRELQNKATGKPGLSAETGNTGAMLMGAADLGMTEGGKLSAKDYDALYSLLQRYRDELVGMGLDYDKLVSRLEDLKKKSADLTERMDKLHPLDGLKIHGRAITTYSDLHITGPAGLNFLKFIPNQKPIGDGIKYEGGINRVDVDFELTRGMLSGLMEVNLEGAWGSGQAAAGFRRFYIEIRSPLAFQFGQVETNLTPLTLWRNEDPNPFEPEPFKGRRERARKDYELVPEKLRLTGLRMSTELWVMNSFTVDLESTTGLISHPFDTFRSTTQLTHYTNPNNVTMTVANTTYLEAWRIGAILPMGLDLSWNGSLFFDDTQSRPESGYRGLQELVNTAKVKYEKGIFFADAEFATSSFTPPSRTNTAVVDPLTGTAMVANLGLRIPSGSIKAYYRSVGSGFHAAGAQTRTQDGNFEYLGPFMTEITQINTAGGALNDNNIYGVGLGMPPAPETVWNNLGIIPPGSFVKSGNNLVYAGSFSHLLPYNFLNDMSPYGMATPNRDGFGLEGNFKFRDGLLIVKAGFESAVNLESVLVKAPSLSWAVDSAANTAVPVVVADPFSYQQMRIGLESNFKAYWPTKVSLGWTTHDTHNGQNSWKTDLTGNPIPYALTSQLLQSGVEVHPTEKLTMAVGYQHTDASGFTDSITVNGLKVLNPKVTALAVSYDQVAYAIWWYITEAARVDLLYENLYYNDTDVTLDGGLRVPGARWEADTALIRFQVDF